MLTPVSQPQPGLAVLCGFVCVTSMQATRSCLFDAVCWFVCLPSFHRQVLMDWLSQGARPGVFFAYNVACALVCECVDVSVPAKL